MNMTDYIKFKPSILGGIQEESCSKLLKDFFKEKNVPYTEYDVAADNAKRQEVIEKSGQMGVPVIIIGDDLVIGFNKPKIIELLGLQ